MSDSRKPGSSFASPGSMVSNAWVVRGVGYVNSAAKFWRSFLDDVRRRYPSAWGLTLAAPGDGPLHPGLLMPEQTLAESLKRMDKDTDFALAMRGIAAELEAAGPPQAVSLTVFAGDESLKDEALTDVLDAEVFPFLLVWLLEWGCLKETAWNWPRLHGEFNADDQGRGMRYYIYFLLKNRYLSEGLYRRSLVMQWDWSDLQNTEHEKR